MIDNVFKKEFFSINGDIVSLRLIETVEGDENELPFYWWSIVENATETCVGKISLRLGHNYHSYWNGNVGYEVDEPHRGHGYAATALEMVFPLAKAHGMDHLIVSCDEDNIASYRTIERCGGTLLEISDPPEDWIYYQPSLPKKRIYRIDLSR